MGTRLLLVRHGETEWHAENRYAGTSDVALTASGERQADALARSLALASESPAAVYCSPLSRARRTAEPSARALDRGLEIEPKLREVYFGIAEGRVLAELPDDVVRRFRADPVAGAFPESESPAAAAERGVEALRAIADRHPHDRVLVVAHNTLLRLTLCRLLGIPLATYRTVFPRLDNGAITELDVAAGHTSLRRFNVPAACE